MLLVPPSAVAPLISRAVLGIFDNHRQNPCLGKARRAVFGNMRGRCAWIKRKDGDFSVPMSPGFIIQV